MEELETDVDGPDSPRARSWLESKLVLVIISSLLIPLVIALYQNHYEATKWIIQNEYENKRARAQEMKTFLSELSATQAAIREAYTLTASYQSTTNTSIHTKMEEQVMGAVASYSEHLGKSDASLINFDNRAELRRNFDEYSNISRTFVKRVISVASRAPISGGTNALANGYPDPNDPLVKMDQDYVTLSQGNYASLKGQATKFLEEAEKNMVRR